MSIQKLLSNYNSNIALEEYNIDLELELKDAQLNSVETQNAINSGIEASDIINEEIEYVKGKEATEELAVAFERFSNRYLKYTNNVTFEHNITYSASERITKNCIALEGLLDTIFEGIKSICKKIWELIQKFIKWIKNLFASKEIEKEAKTIEEANKSEAKEIKKKVDEVTTEVVKNRFGLPKGEFDDAWESLLDEIDNMTADIKKEADRHNKKMEEEKEGFKEIKKNLNNTFLTPEMMERYANDCKTSIDKYLNSKYALALYLLDDDRYNKLKNDKSSIVMLDLNNDIKKLENNIDKAIKIFNQDGDLDSKVIDTNPLLKFKERRANGDVLEGKDIIKIIDTHKHNFFNEISRSMELELREYNNINFSFLNIEKLIKNIKGDNKKELQELLANINRLVNNLIKQATGAREFIKIYSNMSNRLLKEVKGD